MLRRQLKRTLKRALERTLERTLERGPQTFLRMMVKLHAKRGSTLASCDKGITCRGGGGKILRKEQLDIIAYSTSTTALPWPGIFYQLPYQNRRPIPSSSYLCTGANRIVNKHAIGILQPMLLKEINKGRRGGPILSNFRPYLLRQSRTKFLRLVVWCGSRPSIASHLGVRAVGAAPFFGRRAVFVCFWLKDERFQDPRG